MAQRHEIRMKFSNDSSSIIIDGNAITVSNDIAEIIHSALVTYLNEWYSPLWTSPTDAVYSAVMSTMKVRVTKSKDEIVFAIEE